MALPEDAFAAARQAWPGVSVPDETVAQYVAARGGSEVVDLYLACACQHHDEAALAHFERELGSIVERAVRKLGGDRALVADIGQRLRERILLGTETQPARITEYTGRGPLRGWLHVIASREVLDVRRREQFYAPLADTMLERAADPAADPALQYLKTSYRAAFRAAFRDAFASLEPLDRDLLRLHHVDGDTIDALATRHAIHRATAARWLARARERLLAGTRERLGQALGCPDAELDSVLDLIASRLEISLRSQI